MAVKARDEEDFKRNKMGETGRCVQEDSEVKGSYNRRVGEKNVKDFGIYPVGK